ncbi:3'(2'),5'-bisphosphate nucleotidase CysQ [uncultured Helicobacter sp.]|uniref:3'(2'),5'-bisphosphate nucleotidase CysQ n=1 Tax=uncultured Helicobacter sp. TaxID=175537 RepID=UPI00374E5032
MLHNIDLEAIKDIAFLAGEEVMRIYRRDFKVYEKADRSPLSEADIVANRIICESLTHFSLPLLSEENKHIPFSERKGWEYFFMIDPIDGTKEFIKKNGEFTINIALIHKHTPVLGVVYAPAIGIMYSAKSGYGAFKNNLPLPLNKTESNVYTIVASKSHMSEETRAFIDSINTNKSKNLISMGSSLKLCLVASGQADIYPRLAPTMEWDTAAADAIVREAGKMCYDFSTKKPLVYNKKNLENPYFVVE